MRMPYVDYLCSHQKLGLRKKVKGFEGVNPQLCRATGMLSEKSRLFRVRISDAALLQ